MKRLVVAVQLKRPVWWSSYSRYSKSYTLGPIFFMSWLVKYDMEMVLVSKTRTTIALRFFPRLQLPDDLYIVMSQDRYTGWPFIDHVPVKWYLDSSQKLL